MYPGFSLVNLNNTGSVITGPGLQPPSSPNAITSGPVDKINPSIPPKFDRGDKSVNRFTMDTISYACALAGQSVAPTMCTIGLTGVKADGSKDVFGVLTYIPKGGTEFATTNLGPLGFTDLLEVKVELIGLIGKGTGMFFDEVASVGCLIDPMTGGTT